MASRVTRHLEGGLRTANELGIPTPHKSFCFVGTVVNTGLVAMMQHDEFGWISADQPGGLRYPKTLSFFKGTALSGPTLDALLREEEVRTPSASAVVSPVKTLFHPKPITAATGLFSGRNWQPNRG